MKIIAPLLVIVLAILLVRVQVPRRVTPLAEVPAFEMMCVEEATILVGKFSVSESTEPVRCTASETETAITITFRPLAPFSGTCEKRPTDPNVVCRPIGR